MLNNGTIALRPTRVSAFATVHWNNYRVSYDLAGGGGAIDDQLVYGPTLAAVGHALPGDPSRAGYVFDGWHLDEEPFTVSTRLPGSIGEDGPTVGFYVVPEYDPDPVKKTVTVTATWVHVGAVLDAGLGEECDPGSTLTVPGDADVDSRLAVACDITLALAGHDLQTEGFDVAAGAQLTVTDSVGGGSVSAFSTDATPAFDAGSRTSSLTLDATTYIGDGSLAPGDWGDVRITADGSLLGTPSAPIDGHLTGSGSIANNGAIGIRASSVDPGVSITGHHHRVTFATGGGSTLDPTTVYAPTFEAGHRTLPAATRGIDRFDGWTRAGSAFDATSSLPGSSTSGAPVAVSLTAAWTAGTASLGADLSTTSTVAASFTPVLTDGSGATVATDLADWEFTAPAWVTLAADGGAGTVAASAQRAGTYTVTGSYTTGGRTYTDTLQFAVLPGPVADLRLRFTGEARQGSTIIVHGTTVDAAGNTIADVSDEIVLTSSVATDIIRGNRVTFRHASPHIITVTWNNAQLTSDLRVWVTPAGLADTGAPLPTLPISLYALVSLAAGAWMIVSTRRRENRRHPEVTTAR